MPELPEPTMRSPPAASGAGPDTPGVPADHETTFRFLDLLFEGVDGFVEFRLFPPGMTRKRAGSAVFLPPPLDRIKVEAEVLSHDGRRGIAFGPAPRYRIPTRGGPGKVHDVLQVGCVWAVFEHTRTGGGAVEVMRRISDLPLRPSVTINTGTSHYLYFVLRDYLRDTGLIEWEDLARELGDLLSARAPGSLEQVLPLPGVMNVQGALSLLCRVTEEYSSWSRYGLDELRSALREAARRQPVAENRGSVIPGGADHTVERLRARGLDADIIGAVITGSMPARRVGALEPSGGGSGRDFQIAFALFGNGLSVEEVKAIFRAHPGGCGSRWARMKSGEKYLDSLLAKVAARFGELKAYAPGDTSDRGLWPAGDRLPAGYLEHEDGSVWLHPPVADDSRRIPAPLKVSDSPIRITGIRENVDTGQIYITLSFEYLGNVVLSSLPRSHMSNPRQLAAALSGIGAPVTSVNARLVTSYLAAYERHFAPALPKRKVTSRFGRGRADDGPFFFPGVSSEIEFIPLGEGDSSLFRAYASRRGSLAGWVEAMRVLADETLVIPQVAVLAAFVPPLQRGLRIPNFILDLYGNTSSGKSTSLKLAASVYGRPHDPDSLIFQWLNTSTAVEQVAATCSDLPVFLDDAQHCPAELKRSLIYMIANGRGKGRGASGGRGGIGETLSWHTVALSTSEEPLHEASSHEGARGRILSVGGVTPPFKPGTAELVQGLERAVVANHGHAGVAYLRHLNGLTEPDWSRWRRRYAEVRQDLTRGAASDLLGRVGGYVAAIQIAAELASPLLGLPFRPDVVGAWLKLHIDEQYGSRNMVLQVLRVLADYYVTNVAHFAGDGGYDPDKRSTLSGLSKRGQYVGFLRSVIDTVFRAQRWSQISMLDKLSQAGALHATESDRYTKKVSVAGVHHRMICIKWSALLPDDTQSLG